MTKNHWLREHSLYVAWGIALLAMLGSIYFAEVLGIPRCLLCWWQDIFMYPLVVIFAVGILRHDDRHLTWYAFPLVFIGGAIALYQNLLVWHVLSEKLAPCTLGVSCVTQTWTALHFITIPLLSLTAFTIITVLMFIHRSAYSHE